MNHTDPGLERQIFNALTIAGSDSCGGAGIQADIKTMTCLGVEAASVITAVTAQNTQGVHDLATLETRLVAAQLRAVLSDLPIAAAKTGMLANAGIIETVATGLQSSPGVHLVVDPVMVATSGARLLDRNAEQVLISRLLPLAALVTPNLPEAAALTGHDITTAPEKLAEKILGFGCAAVLIKGGHATGSRVEDLLVTAQGRQVFSHPRTARSIHGTGCALSAAITAHLARGLCLEDAVDAAIQWLQTRIARSWQPRSGQLAMLPLADF
jgi:hydroxymethylpyrimidine/phosphomethylpyrimidine kinase